MNYRPWVFCLFVLKAQLWKTGYKKFSTFVQNLLPAMVREGLILMPGARAVSLKPAETWFTQTYHSGLR